MRIRRCAMPVTVGLMGLTLSGSIQPAGAQELVPAAYTPAPTGVHLLSFASFYSSGEVNFEPSAPIEDANARISVNVATYATTFAIAGRSANLTVLAPFIVGDIKGKYLGQPDSVSRAGFADGGVRLGVNLLGAPAMDPAEFAGWTPTTTVGVSLSMKAPTGQYDSEKLINIGTNRWAFKPEIGLVHPMGPFAIDFYVGGWFFTTNSNLFGGSTQSRAPILSTEAHLRFDAGEAVWLSLDANFWNGGRTTVDGVRGADRQRESRVGGTVAVRLARRHTLRLAGSIGALTRVGGDFDSIGLSYAYSWF